MAEVELECAVYGEGTVFPVKIARDAKVSALQEAIFYKKRYNHQYKFDSSALTLYLARKKEGEGDESKWLKDDDSVDALLQGEIDKQYKKMRPSWKLTKPELLGTDFLPGEEEIHVLVELPEAAAGVASEISTTTQMIKEIHGQVVQTKRKLYVHSRVGSRSSEGRELLRDLNIKVEPVDTVPFAAGDPTPVQAFQWENVRDERGREITVTEEQQRERYRSYVEDNIGVVLAEKELCVLGVEKGRNILSVAIPGYDIDLTGRTDILVLSALAQIHRRHLDFLPGVRMLIEVKKKVESGSVLQALSELIALDLLTDDPVMALLTDLTKDWQFFWVSERSSSHVIIQTVIITKPSEAFQLIRTLLAQSPSTDADIRLPCCREPVKRRKLAKMLPIISEGGESGGIRAAIERYYDIASVLGPDIDMARATASQIARTIPVFSYYS